MEVVAVFLVFAVLILVGREMNRRQATIDAFKRQYLAFGRKYGKIAIDEFEAHGSAIGRWLVLGIDRKGKVWLASFLRDVDATEFGRKHGASIKQWECCFYDSPWDIERWAETWLGRQGIQLNDLAEEAQNRFSMPVTSW